MRLCRAKGVLNAEHYDSVMIAVYTQPCILYFDNCIQGRLKYQLAHGITESCNFKRSLCFLRQYCINIDQWHALVYHE